MADMRRRSPEPPPGAPQIQHKPGLANEMLRELAPLLADGARTKVLHAGFQAHLPKPVEPAQLVQAVAALAFKERQ